MYMSMYTCRCINVVLSTVERKGPADMSDVHALHGGWN